MAKDIKDYLEYSDGTMTQRAADLAHAFANKQTAEELQQKMVDDTAERNDLSDEEIEAFLYENYEDKESTEYIVDGAILTCTNCTIEDRYIKNEINPSGTLEAITGYCYYAPIDESINRSEFPNIGKKALGRLTVTENPAAEANSLKYATVTDCVKENNIPYFGNCLRAPDSELEMYTFNAIHKEANQGMEKRKEGSCKYLMKLESEWENYEIGQSFLSFPDDAKGQQSGITMTSMLFCKHGGFIYPVTSGQVKVEEEVEEEIVEEEEVEEVLVLPEVDAANPQSVKEFMWVFFRNEGFSEYAVAGIIGNVFAETGGTFDPGIISSSGYYGLFQWGKGRREELLDRGEEYAERMGLPEDEGWKDVQLQCEYALDEYYIRTKENTGWSENRFDLGDGIGILGTKDMFENAQNASDAALIWALGFERCVVSETAYEEDGNKVYTELQDLKTRLREAENIYLEFANKN